MLPTALSSSLLSLTPIYEYDSGCQVDGELILIGDWPVQFLPPHGALEQEALAEAIKTDCDGIPTSILSAEHLVAIALKTGRVKDYARIVMFLEQDVVNTEKLNSILLRQGWFPSGKSSRASTLRSN